MRNILVIWIVFFGKIVNAQVVESFSDSNLYANPKWVGDTSKVHVNNALELQTNLSTNADTVYIVTPNAYSNNTVWDFKVRIHFDPSSSNMLRVYLITDSISFKKATKSYFVQIGESGSSDSYDLFKQYENNTTKIIDGPAQPRLHTDTLKARIKVIRDRNGLWSLYTSPDSSTSFTLQGTYSDPGYFSYGYFGFWTKYTSSRSDKFFFDDIAIYPFQQDLHGPKIDSVTIIDSLHLNIVFDELLDTVSTNISANYIIHPNSYTINKTQLNLQEPNKILLSLNQALADGIYSLNIQNNEDIYGNKMNDTLVYFNYETPIVIQQNDILINELFPDPIPVNLLPPYEFIELYNTRAKDISLTGWHYSDGTTSYTFKTGDSIYANEYLILCKQSEVSEFTPYGRVIGLSSWPSLNNTNDSLAITDNNNRLIYSLSYSSEWYRDEKKKQGGYSLELIDHKSTCENFYKWAASLDTSGGTPGRINSIQKESTDTISLRLDKLLIQNDSTLTIIYNIIPDTISASLTSNYDINNSIGSPKKIRRDKNKHNTYYLTLPARLMPDIFYTLTLENIAYCKKTYSEPLNISRSFSLPSSDNKSKIIINEIFADPSPEVKLPLSEFIELLNADTATVNLEGWHYQDPTTTYTFENIYLQPGEVLILCSPQDTSEYKKYGRTVGISPFPSLNNSGDSLKLINKANRIIDEVNYTDAWYRDLTKRNGGWSLERIDPYTSCNTVINWKASSDILGGTPGKLNSSYTPHMDTIRLKINTITLEYDSVISLTFNKSLSEEAVNPAHFFAYDSNNDLRFPSILSTDSPYYSSINLYFSPPFNVGDYQLVCNMLSSCHSEDTLITDTFKVKAFNASDYPIYINEVFADPDPSIGLPPAEYIELHNPSSKPILLKNLKLSDPKTTAIFKDDTLNAYEYVIITSAKDSSLFTSYGKTIGLNSFPSLNNTSDTITLSDSKGNIIDQIAFSTSWYHDVRKQEGGYSLERIDINTPCSGKANWMGSTDPNGGTPGRLNSVYKLDMSQHNPKINTIQIIDSLTLKIAFSTSINLSIPTNAYTLYPNTQNVISVFKVTNDFDTVLLKLTSPLIKGKIYRLHISGLQDCYQNSLEDTDYFFIMPLPLAKEDILINEILFNPYPDGADFVELYNNSGKIVDLQNLFIANTTESDSLNTIKKICDNQQLIHPNEYVVISSDTLNVQSHYFYPKHSLFIQLTSMPTYNDKMGCVVILDLDTTRIDQFNYDENMHFSLVKNNEGISLERRSTSLPTQNKNNWTSASATAGYATPGYENSQLLKVPITNNNNIFLEPSVFSPNNDGHDDLLNIYFNHSSGKKIIRINIFNKNGQHVKELIKNELIGNHGMYSWDGTSNGKNKLPAGIYILLIELFDDQGNYEKIKKTCVLAYPF